MKVNEEKRECSETKKVFTHLHTLMVIYLNENNKIIKSYISK